MLTEAVFEGLRTEVLDLDPPVASRMWHPSDECRAELREHLRNPSA